MGSPLSPAVPDFYMEALEKKVLDTSLYKPYMYKCYVDDTFLIWSHCAAWLIDFVTFLNGVHDNITFTVERGTITLLEHSGSF